MRLAFITACAVVLTLVSAPARAQDASPSGRAARARAHFETGTRAFDEGDYALAIEKFRAAYELTEHPDLLFNIYSAAERAGLLDEAEGALAQYLDTARLRRRHRRALEARLARLRVRIEAERAQAPPVQEALAEVSPDEPAPSEPAPSEPAPSEPAAPEPAAPEPVDISVEPEPPPSAPGGVHPAGVATLVGAGVLLAGFGVFAVLSEVEDQALAGTCGRDTNAPCDASRVQRLEVFNLVADVSWIAGATAAVVGVVLLLALPAEGASTVAFAPWLTPEGAGGGVVGRW